MPITRSIAKKTSGTSEERRATGTSATTTDQTSTEATCTTNGSEQSPSSDNTVTPPVTAVAIAPAGPTESAPRMRPTSKNTKKSEKTRRLAKARLELAQRQVDLAAAQLADLEAGSDDDEEEDSVIAEDGQELRVREWLTDHHVLAIEERTYQHVHSNHQLPTEHPVITAASWNPRAAAPAGETFLPPTHMLDRSIVPLPPPPPPSATPQQPVTKTRWPQIDTTDVNTTPKITAEPWVPPRTTEANTGLKELASAITDAIQAAQVKQPAMRNGELPAFNGALEDWLTFRAAYYESAIHLTDIENMARLRRSLRGAAKEAVQGLLIANADPDKVLKTLEVRFGRPDAIAMVQLDKLKSLPRLTESPRDLCTFSTRVDNVVSTLQAINCVYYLFNPEIARNLGDKLTPTLRRQWYEFSANTTRDVPDLIRFNRFLQHEAELCSPFAPPETITTGFTEVQPRRQRIHTMSENQAPKCRLCDQQNHNIADCSKFKNMSVDKRWDTAKKFRLCFRCLRLRTKHHGCRTKKCGLDDCPHVHHNMLHSTLASDKPNQEPEATQEEKVNSTWTPKVSFLKIAKVHVSGPAGAVETYALLDDGSTVSLIDNALAEQIGADGPEEPLHIATFEGENKLKRTSRRVDFAVSGADGKKKQIQARTIDNLELAAQRIPVDIVQECKHLENIVGETHIDNAEPKMLIGQDNWHLLIASETRTGRRNQPVASLTPLGWVIHGSHTRTLGHKVNFIRATETIDTLDDLVKNYLTADNLYIEPRTSSRDQDKSALRTLRDGTTRTIEGRYQTTLLWKSENVIMPDNYDNTLKRLINIERKLDRDPLLKTRYNNQMEDLIRKGYAEPAPATKGPRTWYLPHFAVVNPLKPQKLRVVHDAAAKTRGVSLNDHLLTGPDLLQPLPGVIMRFRQYEIAVTADISEMFMQITLREEDRDALRYLWRGDRRDNRPPQQYRMRSLIFGASCSPATAIFVMNMNAERFKEEHPQAVAAIHNKHYMDDYLDSFKDTEQAIRVTRKVREIQREAHLDMRKWSSNSKTLLDALDKSNEREKDLHLGSNDKQKVLGLIWDPRDDHLTFNVDLARISPEIVKSKAVSKRQALQIVMSLFDPLGLVSPVTVRAKQILQEVWRRGTDWDAPLDDDLAISWSQWMRYLEDLKNITVPRCYQHFGQATSLQLHVFNDASESAYATVLYWRVETSDGRIHVSLITAKAKVAPLKVMSIPRLELQAAVLGVRMAAAVIKEHEIKPESTTYWTDSRTTLTWIRTGSKSYKPYVAHRVAAIEEHSTANEWRWVPTKLNVADDATRDVPSNFIADHRWFSGPEFLRQKPETWPRDEDINNRIITTEEKTYVIGNRSQTPVLSECIPDVHRFSQWERYLRATARVLQFVELCRTRTHRVNYKRSKGNVTTDDPNWKHRSTRRSETKISERPWKDPRRLPLTAELLGRAEKIIWIVAQARSFIEEVNSLKGNRLLPRHSRLAKLSVGLSDGLIVLKSRIDAAEDTMSAVKRPTILDGNDHATRLWITFTHRRLHHAGVETTVNECKQQHWILRLRPVTRSIITGCLHCRKRTASPPQPITGDLPKCRLAHHQRPFTYTGVDYFGPVLVTVGRQRQKRYVAVFTCLTTRAVHLEVANSLNAGSALMALRRMIARRGSPTQIWSDNGTNFHGAERELAKIAIEATAEEAAKKFIEWRFIPPGAPFMGGAWERMVRSVKIALSAVLHERYPSEEVLSTLLAEVEYSVNSHPLTHVSVEPDDPEALTPNHFLLGGPSHTTVWETHPNDLNIRSSWRASQRLADMFWTRWVREYLPELRNRREPQGKGPELRVGDLVYVVDGNLPRNLWARGRIITVFPGPDKIIRTVDIATQGGVLRRPIRKVIRIPVEPEPAPSARTTTSS